MLPSLVTCVYEKSEESWNIVSQVKHRMPASGTLHLENKRWIGVAIEILFVTLQRVICKKKFCKFNIFNEGLVKKLMYVQLFSLFNCVRKNKWDCYIQRVKLIFCHDIYGIYSNKNSI